MFWTLCAGTQSIHTSEHNKICFTGPSLNMALMHNPLTGFTVQSSALTHKKTENPTNNSFRSRRVYWLYHTFWVRLASERQHLDAKMLPRCYWRRLSHACPDSVILGVTRLIKHILARLKCTMGVSKWVTQREGISERKSEEGVWFRDSDQAWGRSGCCP